MDKVEIRRRLLSHRKQLDLQRYLDLSLHAQQRIILSARFEMSATLALYSPVNQEVATDMIFASALKAGKRVCYPRVDQDALQFYAVHTLNDLKPGSFGVSEPVPAQAVDPGDIDLIIVPGIAFDVHGFRLGYGKGYYDRFLSVQAEVVSVGLGFEFQIHPALPVASHDQKLSYLATEARFIPCHAAATGSS